MRISEVRGKQCQMPPQGIKQRTQLKGLTPSADESTVWNLKQQKIKEEESVDQMSDVWFTTLCSG